MQAYIFLASLCSMDWPQMHHLPASVSQVFAMQVCATMPWSKNVLKNGIPRPRGHRHLHAYEDLAFDRETGNLLLMQVSGKCVCAFYIWAQHTSWYHCKPLLDEVRVTKYRKFQNKSLNIIL